MIDLTDFREEHPDKEQLGFFSEAQLHLLEGKLCEEVLEFLKQEGECTYRSGFFRTVLPDDYHAIFTDFGLEGDKCFAFLTSALGSVVYYYEEEYYAIHPYVGEYGFLSGSFKLLMNIKLSMHLILEESFFMQHYFEKTEGNTKLKKEQVFAFKPTIPEGRSPETSNLEVVDMKEHLTRLAELYEHKLLGDD